MSEQTNQPEPTVGQRIDQFISAVERTLAEGGMGEEERQNIVGDLRVQIEEMLSARTTSAGKPATLADVEAVLSELDPPESYSQADEGKETPKVQHAEQSRGHSCGPGFGYGRGRWRHGGPYWFWKKRRVADAVRRAIHSFSPFGHPAFQGMTDRARDAMGLAKNEARRMQHDFIGTEHLLLGLILERSGVGGKVLADLGVTPERAREETSRLVGPGTSPVTQERLPLTPRLRQAIEEARLHARNLNHDYLGTEHLLLALLDVPAVAPMVLKNLGLNLEQVREEILRQIPNAPARHGAAESATYWPASASQSFKIGGNEYRIIAGAKDTGGVFSAIEALISTADGLGIRKHTREDISLYVLEGSAKLRIGDRSLDLAKGDFSRIPRGMPHEIQPGTQTAKVMIIAAPSGIERMLAVLAEGSSSDAMRDAAIQFGVTTG
jgi:mannose-6-phosphate isomerase-like protein (cupin superfamily)